MFYWDWANYEIATVSIKQIQGQMVKWSHKFPIRNVHYRYLCPDKPNENETKYNKILDVSHGT